MVKRTGGRGKDFDDLLSDASATPKPPKPGVRLPLPEPAMPATGGKEAGQSGSVLKGPWGAGDSSKPANTVRADDAPVTAPVSQGPATAQAEAAPDSAAPTVAQPQPSQTPSRRGTLPSFESPSVEPPRSGGLEELVGRLVDEKLKPILEMLDGFVEELEGSDPTKVKPEDMKVGLRDLITGLRTAVFGDDPEKVTDMFGKDGPNGALLELGTEVLETGDKIEKMVGPDAEGAEAIGEDRVEITKRQLVNVLLHDSPDNDDMLEVVSKRGPKTSLEILKCISTTPELARVEIARQLLGERYEMIFDPESLKNPDVAKRREWVDAQTIEVVDKAEYYIKHLPWENHIKPTGGDS